MGAPMIGVSGGRLAAETARAGALGFLAAGHLTSLDDLHREVTLFRTLAPEGSPLALGFIGHSALTRESRLEEVLTTHQPKVVQFFAPAIVQWRRQQSRVGNDNIKTNVNVAHAHGCQVMAQVGSVAEAQQALEAGVDALIAQGSEAGGHGLRRELGSGTLALSARLVSLTEVDHSSIPVLAAGGIVNGRGLAAALALGCDGVVLGTRLWASVEALGHDSFKQQLASPNVNGPDQVIRTTVVDRIINTYSPSPWPAPYDSVGMLRNTTSEMWDGRSVDLAATLVEDNTLALKYKSAVSEGDYHIAAVYSGEGVGDMHAVEPTYEIIQRINKEAIAIVKNMPRLLGEE